MGFARKGILALSTGFAAAVIVGCGSSGGLLSSSESTRLSTQLDNVSRALSAGDCTTAENDLSQLQAELQSLGGINSTLLDNLDQGVNTIQELTQSKCSAPTSTTSTSTRTKTTTSPTTTVRSTTTSPQQTTTTSTQPTSTSTTGGQGLPTATATDTTGGSSASSTTTTSGNGSSSSTSTTAPTTTSSTATSPAGGATGF